jgi:hypothetical protein
MGELGSMNLVGFIGIYANIPKSVQTLKPIFVVISSEKDVGIKQE